MFDSSKLWSKRAPFKPPMNRVNADNNTEMAEKPMSIHKQLFSRYFIKKKNTKI